VAKISLNTSKTVIVLCKNKCKPVTKKLNFRLSGQVLEPSSSAKYLGITIDKNLLWDHEIHNLAAKLSRSVGFLSKLRHFLDYKTLISIYYALFDSHIIYRLQCFGYINQTSFEKIDKLQKKALKIIHFKSITESTRPLFINSRILPIRKQLQLKNCLFAFDFLKNKQPSYFQNFLRLSGTGHNHVTRVSSHRLVTSMTNTIRCGTYNIPNQISKDWNEFCPHILANIRQISKSTFKKHLHAYIITQIAQIMLFTLIHHIDFITISFLSLIRPSPLSQSALKLIYLLLSTNSYQIFS